MEERWTGSVGIFADVASIIRITSFGEPTDSKSDANTRRFVLEEHDWGRDIQSDSKDNGQSGEREGEATAA